MPLAEKEEEESVNEDDKNEDKDKNENQGDDEEPEDCGFAENWCELVTKPVYGPSPTVRIIPNQEQ